MNGGMKVNKVAFCMEDDGRVGAAVVRREDGWNVLSVTVFDIGAPGLTFCGLQKPDPTRRDGLSTPGQCQKYSEVL